MLKGCSLLNTTTCCNTLQQTATHTGNQHGDAQGLLTATHCNTLQRTATHCNTLQHTATHCNTLQHTATHCNTYRDLTWWRSRTAHCNALQHTATHCNTLQHAATHIGIQRGDAQGLLTAAHCNTLQHTATHCNTLQRTATHTGNQHGDAQGLLTATHCNTMQHTATHCNTLQHTATCCNTYRDSMWWHSRTAQQQHRKRASLVLQKERGACLVLLCPRMSFSPLFHRYVQYVAPTSLMKSGDFFISGYWPRESNPGFRDNCGTNWY